tara:strand:+ start:656 stop:1102 length:447 start_codon:yes stop_codon:yes gene_type:complete
LTIHQNWAWAIAEGHKTIENRRSNSSYRGLLLIHAGRSDDSLDESRAFCKSQDVPPPSKSQLPFGKIVAACMMINSVEFGTLFAPRSPWAEGPWCYILSHIVKLQTPVLCRGMPGLFVPDDTIVQAVLRQLGTNDPRRLDDDPAILMP